jgi:predicted phage gp36 major capsid-like protein
MPQVDFNQVCDEFRQFRGIIDRALAAPGDAAVKQHLQSVSATLDKTFAELQEAYPKAEAAINAQLAGVEQTAQETGAKLAGLKESIAAAAAQGDPAAGAAPPVAPPDPQLGQQLRKEVLERFGDRSKAHEPVSTADREIWQDWNWQDWSNN